MRTRNYLLFITSMVILYGLDHQTSRSHIRRHQTLIYGRKSKCTKGDWYDLSRPMISMQTTRERAEHDQRRRVWGAAFSDTALKDYEGRTAIYQDQLIQRIVASEEIPIDVTELYHQFSFDVMGDLAFGESFDMLVNNGNHWAIKLLRRGMAPLGLLFPTWCFRLLLSIPGATGDWFAFIHYCCQLLDKRLLVRSSCSSWRAKLICFMKDQDGYTKYHLVPY